MGGVRLPAVAGCPLREIVCRGEGKAVPQTYRLDVHTSETFNFMETPERSKPNRGPLLRNKGSKKIN